MFTGIVDFCGEIERVEPVSGGLAVRIASRYSSLDPGESVSVDGACLTVRDPEMGRFWCDISPETTSRTTAGRYRPGAKVNLERALRVGDRLGGHHVQGHVDQVGSVTDVIPRGEFLEMGVGGVAREARAWLVPKGSVAVNGVSLTVNEVTPAGFRLMLVPHTLERTNLGKLEPGDAVNLEFDWMVKVIVDRINALKGQLEEGR